MCAQAVDTPAPAPSPDGPIKLGNVDFSGTLRDRVYVWNWFQAPVGTSQYMYTGNYLRLSLAQQHPGWDWNAEFSVPFIFGLPNNSVDPAPQGALGLGANYYSANNNLRNMAMIFPRQLFVRFHNVGSERNKLQIGRLIFLDGGELTPKNATLATLKKDRISARLIGDFGFSDIGRSFDGVRFSSTGKTDDFTFVAATPTRGVFQPDGWGWNRAGFGYASYTRQWGTGRHSADTRVFVLEYDDWRHILKTDNRPTAVRKADTENILIETYGGHSIHAFTAAPGIFDLVAWGALQTGRWGTQQQHAYAFDLEAGFQPDILRPLKPWVRGGYTEGSGDKNPNDNTHGTFFQVLPTPRLYARFPFFNMMNTEDAFGALILRPHSTVTVSSEFHSLRLTDANDLWYSGGGAYQPWSFGYTGRSTSGRRSLANLYDVSVEFRPNRKLTLTAYLGYAQGLAAMGQIYTQGKNAQFGYLELLYRF